MKSKIVFLLFGSSGRLGRFAVEYFLKKQFSKYYFFAREKYKLNSDSINYTFIEINDLSKEKNIIEAFSKIKLEKEASYFLLNTIGAYSGGNPISSTNYSDWKKMLSINLNVSFLIAKHFSKLVERANEGRICFVSARSGLIPEQNRAAYNISKNALNFLVKTLSIEGKAINLSANAVAPFVIDSKENQEWISDKSLIVKPLEICKVVSALFEVNNVTSGNIIELPNSN